MQIKKFIAPTLKEATQQMKDELGIEAIILGTRVLEGDKRFGMRKVYEITAGMEESAEKKKVSKKAESKADLDFATEIEALANKIYSKKSKEDKPEVDSAKASSSRETKSKYQKEIAEISETLVMREVQKNIVNKITTHLTESSQFTEDINLENFLLSSMASMIPTTNFKVTKQKTNKIALVGPTGVGKTTCIAKLAIISKLIHKLNVGLISIDTYRLGAIDQLRIFSEISDIEMAVAYEPADIPKLIKKFKNKNLIFIDTIGRSQKAKDNLDEIKKYLDAAQVDETILVMNSTSSTRTLNDVAEKFKSLNYNSIIFSKIDEAVAYGNIMNVAVTHNKPVMFLTNGQVIPDDIISVNSQFLANMVFTGKLYK